MMRCTGPAFFLLSSSAILGVACDETEPIPPAARLSSPDGTGAAAHVEGEKAPSIAKPNPSGPAMSANKIAELCAAVCGKTSAMPCVDAGTCTTGCAQTYQQPVCRPELDSMLRCSAESPASAFECGAEGAPALKEEVCEAEQEAAANCIIKVMQQGTKTL